MLLQQRERKDREGDRTVRAKEGKHRKHIDPRLAWCYGAVEAVDACAVSMSICEVQSAQLTKVHSI